MVGVIAPMNSFMREKDGSIDAMNVFIIVRNSFMAVRNRFIASRDASKRAKNAFMCGEYAFIDA